VITCHAWNADGSKVALCPNNNEIHVYAKSGNNYNLETKLTEHDQTVTSIDWAPKSNRIVSCSQDRNAYVWTFEAGKWKPILVILRLNRAATYCKWRPEENKFAVASGAKLVSICYFEEEQDWWVSKHIKKHKSTVLQVDWHPNNSLIVTASTDFKVRIFNAYLKGVDKAAPQGLGASVAFGEPVLELDNPNGWVHASKWSPSGNTIAFAAHDSTIHFADVASGNASVQTLKWGDLPFADLIFVSEDKVIAAGHDNTPVLYSKAGGKWSFTKKVDAGGGAAAATAAGSEKNAAFKVFQNKVDKGESTSQQTVLNTKHQNAITCVRAFKKSGANVSQYSTSGIDGQIAIWSA